MNPKTLTLAVLATLTFSAQAGSFFSDDFEGQAEGINLTPSGWTVSNGSVDVVGRNFFDALCFGSGTCIDLDGSTLDAGELSRSFSLVAGSTYQLAFDLAGNRRGTGTEAGTVSFGTASLAFSLDDSQSNAPYQRFTLDFTPTSNGPYQLTFANNGGDNTGAILDNVSISVSAVPEAQTYLMMALGLAALAFARRRAR
jgi:hypothetical protein